MRRWLVLLVAAVAFAGGCSRSNPDAEPEKSAGASTGSVDATQTTSSAGATSSASRQPDVSDSTATQSQASEYQPYTNARFGFTCEVPRYFAADEGAVNGDGRGFTSPDLAVRVVCSAINNANGQTAAQAYATAQQSLAREGSTVTSKAIQGNTFTLSGLGADGNLYYQRTVWGSGSSNSLLWTYPPQQKADLDPAIAHSAESFEAGNVGQAH